MVDVAPSAKSNTIHVSLSWTRQTAAPTTPDLNFHSNFLPNYFLTQVSLVNFTLFLVRASQWPLQQQLCTGFSQSASRVETVQLTAAELRCWGSHSFTHQTSTSALGYLEGQLSNLHRTQIIWVRPDIRVFQLYITDCWLNSSCCDFAVILWECPECALNHKPLTDG